MSTSKPPKYHIEIKDLKENIFVTQLNERDNETNIRRFPIVKESADGLLKSGINTLQKTSMLRQAVNMEEVDKELADKRKEFKRRMEACKEKELTLKRKEDELQDKMQKFDKFLKENEMKRQRALTKYQQEVKNNKQRTKELENLINDLETLKKRKENLLQKLENFKIFEEYLTSVTQSLPENYFESVGDSVIHTLIQRYEGLEATNKNLIKRNHAMVTDIETSQKILEELNTVKKNQRLLCNSQMSQLLEEKEHLYEKNKKLEETSSTALLKKRSNISELGRITMAINNLNDICRGKRSGRDELSYVQKMHVIGRYIIDKIGVQDMVEEMMLSEEFSTVSNVDTKSISSKKLEGTTPDHVSLNSSHNFPKKFKPLPPINATQQTKYNSSNAFLEKLTAISESHAE